MRYIVDIFTQYFGSLESGLDLVLALDYEGVGWKVKQQVGIACVHIRMQPAERTVERSSNAELTKL